MYMDLVKDSGYPVTDFLPGSGMALVTYQGSFQEVAEADAAIRSLASAHRERCGPVHRRSGATGST